MEVYKNGREENDRIWRKACRNHCYYTVESGEYDGEKYVYRDNDMCVLNNGYIIRGTLDEFKGLAKALNANALRDIGDIVEDIKCLNSMGCELKKIKEGKNVEA